MKKIAFIFLALMMLLTGCAGVSQADYDALVAEHDALQGEYDKLEVLYFESEERVAALQDKISANTTGSDSAPMLDIWGGVVSEKHSAFKLDDETAIVVVYAEGRTQEDFMTDITDNAFTFFLSLDGDGCENGVVVAMTDDDIAWFGYTISLDGEMVAFISEKFAS